MENDLYRHYLDRLRNEGYRITTARASVLEVLCSSKAHLTSSEIIEKVSAVSPETGRASIFRVLELLISLSIIRPTYLETQTPSYCLLNEGGHHAHIICPKCRSITEIQECEFSELEEIFERKYGRTISGHIIELFACCKECEKKEKET